MTAKSFNVITGLDFSVSKKLNALLFERNQDENASEEVNDKWSAVMEYTVESGCDFCIIPLISKETSSFPENLILDDDKYSNVIVPILNADMELIDLQSTIKMFEWINHVGYHAICLQFSGKDENFLNYVCQLKHAIEILRFTHVWIQIPVNSCDFDWYWFSWWNKIKIACEYHENIHLCFELTNSNVGTDLLKWKGEKISCISLRQDIWKTNAAGYPVLPQSLKSFICSMITQSVSFIVPSSHEKGVDAYSKYIKYLAGKCSESLSPIESFAIDYEDVLQMPLQPLRDNLDAMTYETFKQDCVKYELYEKAVHLHLKDKLALQHEMEEERILLAVVGAGGRGPLVECCFNACNQLNCHDKVAIYAVEKNPNALITLKKHASTSANWRDFAEKSKQAVTIVHSDMRDWRPNFKIDILISELLGSFGDNELSPECLDYVLPYLRHDPNGNNGGVSIPSWSKSYISPVCSDHLHRKTKSNIQICGDTAWDIPYVVHMKRAYVDICKSKQVWEFEHSYRNNSETVINNSRSSCIDFEMEKVDKGLIIIHGLAGYFEAGLYENEILCSINPDTHSHDMFSWFPMFFPFKAQLKLLPGQKLRILMERRVDYNRKQIWYEWSACTLDTAGRVVECTPIMNWGGRGHCIGY